jgi:hypothetical protein
MSSQRLKNTLSIVDLAPNASVVLTHGLRNSTFRPLAPDIIFLPSEKLEVTASDTESITVKNIDPAPLAIPYSGVILVEAWHTMERTFDGVQNVDLPTKPYIVTSDGGDAIIPPPIRNPMALPEQWSVTSIGDGSQSGAMDTLVSNLDTGTIRTIRAGSIVGIRTRISQVTDGTVTAIPTVNGVQMPLLTSNILAGQLDDGETVLPDEIPYGAGDEIGVDWSNPSLNPSVDLEAWLEVYEELPEA